MLETYCIFLSFRSRHTSYLYFDKNIVQVWIWTNNKHDLTVKQHWQVQTKSKCNKYPYFFIVRQLNVNKEYMLHVFRKKIYRLGKNLNVLGFTSSLIDFSFHFKFKLSKLIALFWWISSNKNRLWNYSMIIIHSIFNKHITVIIIMSRVQKAITTILSF